MNVLDLFSGIGGFSLGLERAGMRTVAFCEIDPFCREVLRKHWPDVPIYDDVRTLTAEWIAANANRWRQSQRTQCNGKSQNGGTPQRDNFERLDIDVICGGFPCQDISFAGKGAGIDGERSGLWSEFARIVGDVRPLYVIVENVSALLGRGLSRVLGDLAALGFDAEWHCIPACAVGAPHRRDRVWIVAYPECLRRGQPTDDFRKEGQSFCKAFGQEGSFGLGPSSEDVANPDKPRLEGWLRRRLRECSRERTAWASSPLENATGEGWNETRPHHSTKTDGARPFREPSRSDWWLTEPDVGRVAHGVPLRVDRLRALGNAIVPQIAEIIGRAILDRWGGELGALT